MSKGGIVGDAVAPSAERMASLLLLTVVRSLGGARLMSENPETVIYNTNDNNYCLYFSILAAIMFTVDK